MPHSIGCPECQARLRVPEEEANQQLTCPRCLAKVDNPNAGIRSGAPPREVQPPTREAGLCPRCGEAIQPRWRYCPACDLELRRRKPRPKARTVDQETGFDTGLIGGGLILMGLLGVLGAIAFLLTGGLDHGSNSTSSGFLVFWAGIFILPLVGIVLTFTGKKSRKNVAFGVLGGVTIGLVVLGIPLAFVLAVIIAIFSACSNGCGVKAQARAELAAPMSQDIR
jgi:hypothetical protein